MTTPIYNRSEIYSYYDLSKEQQEQLLSSYDLEIIEDSSFVLFNYPNRIEVLPLFNFMRTTGKGLWDGIYGTTYFSAYFIKLSKCGSMAVIAERYC